MKLSTKGKYGLIAMADLAIAYLNDPNDSYLVLKTIATKRNISEAYLERIISKLKKANLIVTQRGSLGGYSLARHPNDINVSDVLYVLEGKLDVGGCSSANDTSCKIKSNCFSQIVCEEINVKIREVVENMTIEDVLKSYLKKSKEF
ncbi:MAG: Rrf2 family transcriptional regulator [Firmicutes bacterium]|nr:Rrf2 family transcriptional regulator [Bacillota bacterium]